MKILICVVTRMTNRGVDALVASKASALGRTFPGCRIDVLTPDWVVNRPFLEARGLGCIEDVFQGWRHTLAVKAGPLGPLVQKFADRRAAELKRMLSEYDLAIATGGDNFSSDYGSPRKYLYALDLLADAGVPVVMLGQSIGPFRSDEHRTDFVSTARRMKLITARESATYTYLTQTLALPSQIVERTADTAFLLEPAPADFGEKISRSFGVKLDKPVIALSVSGGITGFASENAAKHLAALERMSQRLLAETPAQLLLIPHVEDHDPSNNDMIVADQLLRRLDFDPRVKLAKGYLTSNEFKAIVARCDMVVAERMHVAIAGLSSGLATFVIGYSVKGNGIMSDCFGEDAENAGLVVPLQDFIADNGSDDKVLAVWHRREELGKRLKEQLPDIRKRAERNFELLEPIVRKGNVEAPSRVAAQ